nr:putative reverse transcriptase domain-containing protein [Tanacetum cinerariifolium]
MDGLSKHRVKIVCRGKVFRIPLAKGEVLQVHEEQSEGNLKSLKSTIAGKKKLDDILIVRYFLESNEDHKVHLKLVLELLKKEKLHAKFSKCEFWLQEVHFLRYLVEDNDIHVDTSKIEVGAEQEEAFQNLKDNLCNSLILTLLDGPDDFMVYCDASKQGFGCVLIQRGVKDNVLVALIEASKVENMPAEMLHGIDHQMEKKEDGGLYFMDRIWVPLVGGVRTSIMDEACTMRYSIHSGADKMYYDLRDIYWWSGRKKDIATYVSKCMTCLKVKSKHQRPSENITESVRNAVRYEYDLSSQTVGQTRYVRPFEIIERIGLVAYHLRLPQELSGIHNTFHMSNLKRCLAYANLYVLLEEIKVDKTLCFIKEPIKIMDREVKRLKRSRILIIKVHWNSKRGPEFTWEREDHMKAKYPHLFSEQIFGDSTSQNHHSRQNPSLIISAVDFKSKILLPMGIKGIAKVEKGWFWGCDLSLDCRECGEDNEQCRDTVYWQESI